MIRKLENNDMKQHNKKLVTESREEELNIIDAARDADLSDFEIAALLTIYNDYNYSKDECIDIINDLNISINSYDSNSVDVDGMEFLVFDDYDDAEQYAVEYVENIIDDGGIDPNNVSTEYVDEEWFKDALLESMESYCYDISDESSNEFENRLVEECYDRGIISDDDFDQIDDYEPDYYSCKYSTDYLVDRYVSDYEDSISGDYIGEYISQFGQEEFNNNVKEYDLINFTEYAEYCVDVDGIAHFIAGYDGNEHETEISGGDIFYVYRNN